MKNKLILFAFIVAGVLLYVALCHSQEMVQPPKSYCFHSRIGGYWLAVSRHNLKDDPNEFDPCYTNITSAYKPIVHKIGDQWTIEFTSDIAENLP